MLLRAAHPPARAAIGLSASHRDPGALPPLPSVEDLAAAILRGESHTEFQPQVALASGALLGAEALARWTHHAFGPVRPDRFIPIAEEAGLIRPLTMAVLRQALAAIACLCRHHPAATVSVTVSLMLLDSADLPDEITAALDEAGQPPAALVLEITEGHPFANPDSAAQSLATLRSRGVGCSMDDFGTGYATLPALLQMPFTELKIDRSFVAHAADLPEAARLVRATVRLGQALGLRVIAEGIETETVERLLLEAGCDAG